MRVDLITTDILIIGSGPVGSTFARVLADHTPILNIIMVDAGPKLGERAGIHVRNIVDPEVRARAQAASRRFHETLHATRPAGSSADPRASLQTHPGTFLLNPNGNKFAKSGMPAAAISSNVGGMAAYWTCACPRPADTERVPLIEEHEWAKLCTQAEMLLHVSTTAYSPTSVTHTILHRLKQVFASRLPPHTLIGNMPLACTVTKEGERIWSGAEAILGPLALPETAPAHFSLLAETICTRLVTNDREVEYAVLLHIPSRTIKHIRARVFIIAADAFRTPQLLWKSDIKSKSLGHYLNEHPQTVCTVRLEAGESSAVNARPLNAGRDPTLGIFWVPFHDPSHQFHGEVVHFESSPIGRASLESHSRGDFVTLVWFCRKEIQYDDYLEFVEKKCDVYGMPGILIHYRLTDKDRDGLATCRAELKSAGAALGSFLEGGQPWTLPSGSSFHYLGTTRMGETSEDSVCDAHSQVWGVANVFVGGNGTIPSATACNPTLTSCAIAIRACERICDMLGTSDRN